jgi:hypothetical protein
MQKLAILVGLSVLLLLCINTQPPKLRRPDMKD